MADDTLAERLAAIRERAEQLTASHADEDCDGPDPCTGHDALRMADGYDALLKLADEWHAKGTEIWAQVELQDCDGASAGFKAIGGTRYQSSAKELREAITRALTGEPDATPPAPEAPPGSSETEAAYVLRRLAATAAGLPATVLPLTGPERDHLAEEFRREYREARAPGKDGPA